MLDIGLTREWARSEAKARTLDHESFIKIMDLCSDLEETRVRLHAAQNMRAMAERQMSDRDLALSKAYQMIEDLSAAARRLNHDAFVAYFEKNYQGADDVA